MKSSLTAVILAGVAFAGITLSWDPVECDYAELQIRTGEVVLAVVEAEEDGFPVEYELKEAYHVVPESCIGCGICVGACPVEAITVNDEGKAVIDPELCINCGICAGSCPVDAIFPLNPAECSLYGVTAEGEEELLQEGFEED